jgi:hypothetical protein
LFYLPAGRISYDITVPDDYEITVPEGYQVAASDGR